MLTHLHVKNLALIREAEIDFTEGLNILTGETGAGKSIVIGSVSLALGGRVAKDMVRPGADYGLAELVFLVNRKKQREKLHEDWDIINSKVHKCYPEIVLTPEVEELGVVKYKDEGNLTYVDEKILFTLISYMRTIDPMECDMDSVIDDIYAMVK